MKLAKISAALRGLMCCSLIGATESWSVIQNTFCRCVHLGDVEQGLSNRWNDIDGMDDRSFGQMLGPFLRQLLWIRATHDDDVGGPGEI